MPTHARRHKHMFDIHGLAHHPTLSLTSRSQPKPLLGRCFPQLKTSPTVVMNLILQLQVVALVRPFCVFAEVRSMRANIH